MKHIKLQNFNKVDKLSNHCIKASIVPFLIICNWFILSNIALAQSSDPLLSLFSLEDLSGFKNAPRNWHLAGDIYYDLNNEKTAKEEKGKGIIINHSKGSDNGDLLTNFEHGDIDLEFDFMLPKGSTAGVYLQGRYGIRLNDSWNDAGSMAQASGAIYLPYKDNKQLAQAVPPRMNVCKAPGLWQNLKVSFQAPKFNNTGKKVSNAKFNEVVYNGVVIHANIEVPGVTSQSLPGDENPLGSLMFSGNSEIAIRNIRYKIYGNEKVKIKSLRYSYYDGKFDKIAEVANANPSKSDDAEEITWKPAGGNQASFALKFDGHFVIPKSGAYVFWIQYRDSRDSSQLVIDNKIVIAQGKEVASQELEKGNHTFSLLYIKNRLRGTPQLGLFVEGPGIARHPLHAASSLSPPSSDRPIIIEPEKRTIVQGCFMRYGEKKSTFCVAVGEPGQIHYAMDLSQGAIINLWKGEFLDATTMWTGRGVENIAEPLGSIIELSPGPSFAFLQNADDAWPDSIRESDNYKYNGYHLDDRGRPTFKYVLNKVRITDMIIPENKDQYLTRTFSISNQQNIENLWFRLAKGTKIELLSKGLYGINDKSYYIRVDPDREGDFLLRKAKNGDELLIPGTKIGNTNQLSYSIIW